MNRAAIPGMTGIRTVWQLKMRNANIGAADDAAPKTGSVYLWKCFP